MFLTSMVKRYAPGEQYTIVHSYHVTHVLNSILITLFSQLDQALHAGKRAVRSRSGFRLCISWSVLSWHQMAPGGSTISIRRYEWAVIIQRISDTASWCNISIQVNSYEAGHRRAQASSEYPAFQSIVSWHDLFIWLQHSYVQCIVKLCYYYYW